MLDIYDLKKLKDISIKLNNIKKVTKEKVKRQDIISFIDEIYNKFDYTNFFISKDKLELTKVNKSVNPDVFAIQFIPFIENPEEIIINYNSAGKQEKTYHIKFCDKRTYITKKFYSKFGQIETTTEWEYLDGWLIKEIKHKNSKGLYSHEIIESHEAYFDKGWDMLIRKQEEICKGKSDDYHEISYECQSFIVPININTNLSHSAFHDGISYLNMSSSLFQNSNKQHYEEMIKGMTKRKILTQEN